MIRTIVCQHVIHMKDSRQTDRQSLNFGRFLYLQKNLSELCKSGYIYSEKQLNDIKILLNLLHMKNVFQLKHVCI